MARDIADMKNQQMMQSVMQSSQAAMYELSRTILKENTVLPGRICGGIIQMDTPSVSDEPRTLKIMVTTGGENHVFKYQITKSQ